MACLIDRMRVRVDQAAVAVAVLMDQIRSQEQCRVRQDGRRQAVSCHPSVLAQDHGSIGDQRYDVQLVGRHHEGSTGRQPGDELDQDPLRPGVQGRRRLVQKQHLRPEREHGSDRRPLLLATR